LTLLILIDYIFKGVFAFQENSQILLILLQSHIFGFLGV
jgi:hypothetical protein